MDDRQAAIAVENRRRRRRPLVLLLFVLAVVAGGGFGTWLLRPGAPPDEISRQAALELPSGFQPGSDPDPAAAVSTSPPTAAPTTGAVGVVGVDVQGTGLVAAPFGPVIAGSFSGDDPPGAGTAGIGGESGSGSNGGSGATGPPGQGGAPTPGDGPTSAPGGGTSAAFTIAGRLDGALYPGVSMPLDLRLTNPNADGIRVTSLAVEVTRVDGARGRCDVAANFAVVDFRGDYATIVVPGRRATSLSALGVPASQRPAVTMRDTGRPQDSCQGAELSLAFRGTAVGGTP